MSDSVQPHRRQPTPLPRPWDSPGKNTGVGCHFLLQCMKVKSESEVAQSYLTLSDPMDCSLPGSSVHGIFQARLLEWGANSGKELICQCRRCKSLWFHPSVGSPGEENSNLLQYSCLENSMDREAWEATVHRVTKSWTQLSDFTLPSPNLLCLLHKSPVNLRDEALQQGP